MHVQEANKHFNILQYVFYILMIKAADDKTIKENKNLQYLL